MPLLKIGLLATGSLLCVGAFLGINRVDKNGRPDPVPSPTPFQSALAEKENSVEVRLPPKAQLDAEDEAALKQIEAERERAWRALVAVT